MPSRRIATSKRWSWPPSSTGADFNRWNSEVSRKYWKILTGIEFLDYKIQIIGGLLLYILSLCIYKFYVDLVCDGYIYDILASFTGDVFIPKRADKDYGDSASCCKWETQGKLIVLSVKIVAYVLVVIFISSVYSLLLIACFTLLTVITHVCFF